MHMKKILVTSSFFVLSLIIVVWSMLPIKYDLKVGDISRVSINSPKEVVNEYETLKHKKMARLNVLEKNKIYKKDNSVFEESKNSINNFFKFLNNLKFNKDNNQAHKLKLLQNQSLIKLNDDEYVSCLKIPKSDLKKLQGYCVQVCKDVMDDGIEENQINKAIGNVKEDFQRKNMSQDLRRLGSDIVAYVLKPNRLYDAEATNDLIKKEETKVQSVIIKEGQKIVDQGQVVNDEQISILSKLGLLKSNSKLDYGLYVTVAILLLFIYGVFYWYIAIYHEGVRKSFSKLTMIQIIFLLNILIAAGMNNIHLYLVPTAIAGILVSILIDAKFAVLVNVLSTIIIAIMTRGQMSSTITFSYIYISIISGTIACIYVSKANNRSSIFGVGLLVGVANMFLITILEYISGSNLDIVLLLKSLFGLASGILAITLAIGSLPFWELIFDVLTPFKLLELSNPNQPLIRRMLMEMPGTYHHSLVVGNLAEAAIQEIGGNPLLARVGAYYHDIGKISRPYFFKENQFGDNPHEKLTPNLSTLVITSHVKDGVELGMKYKLPMQIIDFIQQHHGDTLVAYFYHKALQQDEDIKEENFRYPGPLPQTKETAVVMLADSIEAAVRAMQDPTRGKVEGLIRKIIKDKLDDGQLEECPLTLKDMDKIAKTFVKVLSGVFHERIEYPEISKDKDKERLSKPKRDLEAIEDPIEKEIRELSTIEEGCKSEQKENN